MKDAISVSRINQLHPKARDIFKNFIEECESSFNIILRIMNPVFRTIQEQDELYAQGRTKPGKVVTNSKGGQSYHNYGLAVDLCEMNANDKQVLWSYDMGALEPIAEKYNLQWGGDFQSIKDRPHFQLTFGMTWQELFALYQEKKIDAEGYVLIPSL